MTKRKRIAACLLVIVSTGVATYSLSSHPAASSSDMPSGQIERSTTSRPALGAPRHPLRGDLSEWFSGIAAAESDEDLANAIAAGHRNLVQILQTDPEAYAALEEFLLKADPSDPQTRVAVGSLIELATPEAQQLLLRVLNARLGEIDVAQQILPSLAFIRDPLPAVEERIAALATDETSDHTTTAKLSMGIMASKMDERQPKRSRRIVDGYINELRAASDPRDKLMALAVLGNAATAEAAEAVSPYLHDADPTLRSGAAESLRLVHTAKSEEQLLALLMSDPSEAVRVSAARALAYHSSEATLRGQMSALPVEPSESVALVLVDNVWARRTALPDAIVAALRDAAGRHRAAVVRSRALELVATVAGQP